LIRGSSQDFRVRRVGGHFFTLQGLEGAGRVHHVPRAGEKWRGHRGEREGAAMREFDYELD